MDTAPEEIPTSLPPRVDQVVAMVGHTYTFTDEERRIILIAVESWMHALEREEHPRFSEVQAVHKKVLNG